MVERIVIRRVRSRKNYRSWSIFIKCATVIRKAVLIRNTFVTLCHKHNEKNAINGVDVVAITDRDIVEFLYQYEKRSTEKFELQQSRLQK